MTMSYYIRERLGPKQSTTPEGFLLCEDVPIARTGGMVYGPGETPIAVGSDGIAHIEREPQEVFRTETIQSVNGKPVVNGHPENDVTPDNWGDLAVGVAMNARRGQGALDDVLLADLLITRAEDIKAVRQGLREVSCGYDADYIQTAPGKGRQTNIVMNHVALVESGRCGPRCAIGDQQTIEQENTGMTLVERLKNAFKSKDEAAFTAVLDEVADDGKTATHIHVHTRDDDDDRKKRVKDETEEEKKKREEEEEDEEEKKGSATTDARLKKVEDDVKCMKDDIGKIKKHVMDDDDDDDGKKSKDEEAVAAGNRKIEGSLEMEAPPGTSDGVAAKAKDSSYLEDSWQEALSLAEVIVPGHSIGIATFDRSAAPRKTFDALCRFRRQVLDLAYLDKDTHVFMDGVMNGRDLKQYTCDGVRTLFRAVGVYRKQANNKGTNDQIIPNSGGGTGVKARVKTPAELNKAMAEFYASK